MSTSRKLFLAASVVPLCLVTILVGCDKKSCEHFDENESACKDFNKDGDKLCFYNASGNKSCTGLLSKAGLACVAGQCDTTDNLDCFTNPNATGFSTGTCQTVSDCSTCVDGKFCDCATTANCDKGQCKDVTKCTGTQYVSTDATPYADQVCSAKKAGGLVCTPSGMDASVQQCLSGACKVATGSGTTGYCELQAGENCSGNAGTGTAAVSKSELCIKDTTCVGTCSEAGACSATNTPSTCGTTGNGTCSYKCTKD